MTDQITPALTPEEWANVAQERPLFARHSIVGDVECLDAADKHAAAAVALHGHPAGFTWEMVDALREIARDSEGDSFSRGLNYEAAHAAINNMAALLPPREGA